MEEQIHINARGNIIDILKQMKAGFEANSKSADSFQKTAVGSLDKITSSLKNINLAALNQNIQNLGQGFEELNRPGLDFNSNLAELSALTNTTGKDLDLLGEKARASALEFGGTASDSLNSYKTILSRLGPDIAKDQEALNLMERDVRILSKTMGGDATGAVDALTTAALQFGVDLSNPRTAAEEMTKMMDVMANSAQEGAAEVPQISAALKVSGVAAQQANVNFIEANAAIQALAAGGKEGAEAGTAFRNVLGKLAGEEILTENVVNKLKQLGVDMDIVSDTTLPFTDRLRELSKAQGDAVIMTQMFGVENAAAANILLNSVDAQDELAEKVGKTGGAQAQANIVMESASEKLARMQAKIDDAKIAFFEMTGGMTVYLGPATEVLRTLTSLTPIYTASKTVVLALATAKGRAALAEKAATAAKLVGAVATKAATAATVLWNAALSINPIVAITLAVGVLATAIYGVVKAFDTSTAAQKANEEITRKVNSAMAEEEVQLGLLFGQLKRTNPGTEERKELVSELSQKYPELLEKYDLEKASLEDIDRLQREATKSARKRIELQLKEEKATDLLREAQEIEDGSAFANNNWTEAGKMEEVRALRRTANGLLKEIQNAKFDDLKKRTKKKKKEDETETTETDDETEPPKTPTLGTTDGYSDTDSKSKKSSRGTVKSINVHIESLNSGDFNIYSSNVREGAAEIRKILTEELVGVIRDFETGI